MILILDLTNTTHRILLVDRDSKTLSVAPQKGVFVLLEKALGELRKKRKKLTAVAVLTGVGEGRDSSWSTIRLAVAMGNALAFSASVPAVEVEWKPGMTDEDIAEAARRAKPPKERWVAATYNAEPNITKAKK